MASQEQPLDQRNAEFWDELCGSGMALALGIVDRTAESLARFDQAYLDYYPYLLEHVQPARFKGKRVLEVGLGYGTLSEQLARAGADYTGLDIARGPVEMVAHRLAMAGLPGRTVQGSVLATPFEANSFDGAVAIGSLHHTGNLQQAFDELRRVLAPGGVAVLMVYNQFSYRQWQRWPGATWQALRQEWRGQGYDGPISDDQRAAYDAHVEGGVGAPETVFTSVKSARRMLSAFSRVTVQKENNDAFRVRRFSARSRLVLLPVLGRLAGLDLYIEAVK